MSHIFEDYSNYFFNEWKYYFFIKLGLTLMVQTAMNDF